MIQKWDIQRTEGRCTGSERKLEPGEEFYAALIDKQSCFERADYSVEYWNEHHPEVYSFWKTTFPEANEKKRLFVDDSVLFNFFERLEKEEEPLKINFRFVLGLILVRKRMLKYEQTRRDGERVIWYIAHQFVERLQSLGYLPNAATEIHGQITHHLGTLPGGMELRDELARIEAIVQTSCESDEDDQRESTLAAIAKLKNEASKLALVDQVDELKRTLANEKGESDGKPD